SLRAAPFPSRFRSVPVQKRPEKFARALHSGCAVVAAFSCSAAHIQRRQPMQLAVTFRHMDATPALKDYAKEKVERINKYFPDPIKAHVVLSCERDYNHVADVMITLHNGFVIKGEEKTEDMYSSIDLVMAKIERQVRRYKEKLRD